MGNKRRKAEKKARKRAAEAALTPDERAARKAAKKERKALKRATPKQKCCASKPRCRRCPIRMLAEGRLDPAQARDIFAREKNRKQARKEHLEIPA